LLVTDWGTLSELEASTVRLVGGHLCLDFINTVGGRKVGLSPAQPGARAVIIADKLSSYRDLIIWSRHAGVIEERPAHKLLLDGSTNMSVAREVFDRAITLREAMYRVFHGIVRAVPASKTDLDLINRELLKARAHERLLWPIVHSAAEFLTDADLSRLRECGGEQCGWLFEDTSRNRSRRWCYMQDCGNRDKVRRFRSRKKNKKKR
jgi:predicted RNA-binding Zn ribbon-like protein